MDKQELNDGHYFELMDRCHCTINHIESDIADHPALDDENKQKLDQAIQLIAEVYQWAGYKDYNSIGEE